MMFRNQRLVLLGLTLVLALAPRVRAAETAGKPKKEPFRPTITHIEADLRRVLKIERSEPFPPPSPAPTGVRAAVDLNWFGAISLLGFDDDQGRPITKRISILELPFFKHLEVDRQGKFIGRSVRSSSSEYQNWYLFALLDGFVTKDYETPNALGGNSKYVRLAVMDIPLLFSAYRIMFSAPQWTYWDVLDLPLSTTISHLSDTDQNVWTVLEVPFICAWKYKQKGPKIETRLLDFTIASLYQRDQTENRDRRFFLSLFDPKMVWDTSVSTGPSLTILAVPFAWGAPLFYLYRSSVDQNQAPCRQYLKLPFLGPCAGTWTDERGHHFWIFPKLFTKTCPKAIKTVL